MSSKTNSGGQAFPRAGFSGPRGFGVPENGMSLRDYFAAKAMQAAITTSAEPYMSPDRTCEIGVSRMAYAMADAMLAQREKQE